MNFDAPIDRRNTGAAKWHSMEKTYGVSQDEGIPMWVADMDFKSPDAVIQAGIDLATTGIFGYHGDYTSYHQAIVDWMQTRHDWTIKPNWIFTTHGIVNAVAIALHAYTQPDDEVILFTPVYHAFDRTIKVADRRVIECILPVIEGQFELDFNTYETQITDKTKMMILCSPHNPGGRIWTPDELRQIAAFCEKHDLILISDDIHHDLIFPGHKFTPMAVAAPDSAQRLITLTAPSKTFNVAGNHTGNAIIADPKLHAQYSKSMAALSISPNLFGVKMSQAAYLGGAEWLDALMLYLDENRKILTDGLSEIPGVRVMPMQATYLTWVDFTDTGMELSEVIERVQNRAKVVANHGPSFGSGGECHLRFNIGIQKARVVEAVARIQAAFADMQ